MYYDQFLASAPPPNDEIVYGPQCVLRMPGPYRPWFGNGVLGGGLFTRLGVTDLVPSISASQASQRHAGESDLSGGNFGVYQTATPYPKITITPRFSRDTGQTAFDGYQLGGTWNEFWRFASSK
jgi:hypothetical protein